MRRSSRISEKTKALEIVSANTDNVKPLTEVSDKKKTTSKVVKAPIKKKVIKKTVSKLPKKKISEKPKSNRPLRGSNKKPDLIVLDDVDLDDEDEDEEEDEEEEEEEKKELEVGDSLPVGLYVELDDTKKINLFDYAKKSHILVIFAYPKASTPGCTRQAQGFRDEYEELNSKLKANVLGLSADSDTAQTKFKERQNLPFDLIADTKKELITLLGCKKYPSGIIRSHFIFVDGILKIKNVKISPEASYQSALKQVRELAK